MCDSSLHSILRKVMMWSIKVREKSVRDAACIFNAPHKNYRDTRQLTSYISLLLFLFSQKN